MALRDALLPEFDHEMQNTRRTLERLPDDKLDWRPHEKSWTLGALATHIANVPHWATMTLAQDSFDMMPDGVKAVVEVPITSAAHAVEMFDGNVTEARAALATVEDDSLMASWSLLSNGENLMTMPRIAVVRSFIMNHMIHHRGQLTVYLRLNDVPLPALYGPSADEEQ